jgi:hypothetical protein
MRRSSLGFSMEQTCSRRLRKAGWRSLFTLKEYAFFAIIGRNAAAGFISGAAEGISIGKGTGL